MTDHLDRETSVSAELTPTGVKAHAQSRFVAAVDRLGGNLVELVNAPMERRITRQRTVAASEAELIAAVTKFGIEKLHSDPAFAERVAERHFTRVFEKQQNKDAVLREALEDLRHDPAPDEAVEVPLSTEFMDRLEHYAEGATTDHLKQKWGRVLSAEIKRPGSFSAKAMRIVDELDAETARLFESFCTFVFRGVAPKCLTGKLTFHHSKRLVSAGLILDPGVVGSHVALFSEVRSDDGKELWLFDFGDGRAVSVPNGTLLQYPASPDFMGPITAHSPCAAIPAYLLTEVGEAISSIFPPNDAVPRYIQKLREALHDVEIIEFKFQPDGRYRSIETSVYEFPQQPTR